MRETENRVPFDPDEYANNLVKKTERIHSRNFQANEKVQIFSEIVDLVTANLVTTKPQEREALLTLTHRALVCIPSFHLSFSTQEYQKLLEVIILKILPNQEQ